MNCSFNIDNNDFINDAEMFKSYVSQLPKGKFFTVDVTNETGLTESLAKAITEGNKVLELLNDNGFDIAESHSLIQFAISLNDEYFPSIAKVRALKTLWQQVLTAWNSDLKIVSNIEVHLTENAQSEDENYNKIKATTQAMSAVIGGANRLYIYPSDSFKHKKRNNFFSQNCLKCPAFIATRKLFG
ncbi:MAG: hypothetical protein HC803_03850 [Saprospiraceae bacterium]|nr:hypothetical protein [Saprospiraceae bacterium]